MTAAARPLRRDAADNRSRVLAAASTVFARDGVEAGVDQVAREAGVGMGTMYRRFPTKQALIDELLDAVLDDMIAAAQQALASHADGTALEHYLRAAGALLFERRGFLPMVWRREQAAPQINELRAAYADLLADGRRHGRLGDGLSTTDITAALWSLRGVMEASYAVAPDAWVRHLDFLLAGLRAGAAATTTVAMTLDQIDRIGINPTS
jgi:AcrR family transcriptional regulator